MSCQGTKCRNCGRIVPACQLSNGLCSTCTSKGLKRFRIFK